MTHRLPAMAAVAALLSPTGLVGVETDGRVKRSIEHDLRDETIGGVNGTVDADDVTLTVAVDSAWEKREAPQSSIT